MKIPTHKVEQEEIDYALNPTPWDSGNEILYDMCKSLPEHKTHADAIAKIWLIGRSYATAIERRKGGGNSTDNFYEDVVAPGICDSDIDPVISNLPPSPADPEKHIAESIKAHKLVTILFESLSNMENRSLASKYLHFHRKDLFFIYDSRAQEAIAKLTPDCRYIPRVNIPKDELDDSYYKFCMRICWLRNAISKQYRKQLTPRELDNILLVVHRRVTNKKANQRVDPTRTTPVH